ncbi:MAG: hypothetical protein EOL91_04195 [Actinobacteria bacterium]|nr:hypothetical protein [Actinomycetota bacterium]
MIQLALAALGAGMTGYSAYQSYKEGKTLHSQYNEQGVLLKAEQYRQAKIVREQGEMFAQEQKMAYMSTGVQYAGSALITVAQTKSWVESEAKAEERRGDALQKQMADMGAAAARQGRAALVSGLFKAGTSIAKAM